MTSRIAGFYRLTIAQRRIALAEALGLPPDAEGMVDPLDEALSLQAADGMIENVIGTYQLPLAVALNFNVDGRDVIIPMAVEEASIVAAASNAARSVRLGGGFTSRVTPQIMIGQIQLTQLVDADHAAATIESAREHWLAEARRLVPRLVERGGGPVDIRVRVLDRGPGPDGAMIVVHLHIDCCDAMGANLVNTVCEAMAAPMARSIGATIGLRILTNLNDERLVTVGCRIHVKDLADAQSSPETIDASTSGLQVARAIVSASRFADLDTYRAATHNKGIMNGVDAVLVATGQDWRAVEAGAHAFAARSGVYSPLARWSLADNDTILCGELVMPLAVGTVGGALHVHPVARHALHLAGNPDAAQLASIAGAAGLATNLSALRALATEGIQRGHMALHARGVALAAGATGDQVDEIAALLASDGNVKLERARELVERFAAGRGIPAA